MLVGTGGIVIGLAIGGVAIVAAMSYALQRTADRSADTTVASIQEFIRQDGDRAPADADRRPARSRQVLDDAGPGRAPARPTPTCWCRCCTRTSWTGAERGARVEVPGDRALQAEPVRVTAVPDRLADHRRRRAGRQLQPERPTAAHRPADLPSRCWSWCSLLVGLAGDRGVPAPGRGAAGRRRTDHRRAHRGAAARAGRAGRDPPAGGHPERHARPAGAGPGPGSGRSSPTPRTSCAARWPTSASSWRWRSGARTTGRRSATTS